METNPCNINQNVGSSVPSMVSRKTKPVGTIVEVRGVEIGGSEIIIIAGPCAVENREQLSETAKAVKKGGAKILRGGAFKPRSSPYNFQGLGEEGLRLLDQIRKETGLPVVTEVYCGDFFTCPLLQMNKKMPLTFETGCQPALMIC